MKTILIAAAILTASVTPSLADTKPAKPSATEMCRSIGDLARRIMTQRQDDMPMSLLIEAVEKAAETEGQKAAGEFTRALIIAAYGEPDFEVDENREAAIAEFGNQAELVCFQAHAK